MPKKRILNYLTAALFLVPTIVNSKPEQLSRQLSANSRINETKHETIRYYQPRNIETLIKKLPSYLIPKPEPERDYETGAAIYYVSSHELPENVLGVYEPISHTIKIRNNLSEIKTRRTRHHESAHAKGITSEHRADLYAAYKTDFGVVRQFSRKHLILSRTTSHRLVA